MEGFPEAPSGWSRLEKDDRHSTVSTFVGGYEDSGSREILVWQGVSVMYVVIEGKEVILESDEEFEEYEESHEVHEGTDFEGRDDIKPQDPYDYLIIATYSDSNEPVMQVRARSPLDVRHKLVDILYGEQYPFDSHLTEKHIEEFHGQLCGLIDEFAENDDDRFQLIQSLEEFKEAWMDTYGATCTFWR